MRGAAVLVCLFVCLCFCLFVFMFLFSFFATRLCKAQLIEPISCINSSAKRVHAGPVLQRQCWAVMRFGVQLQWHATQDYVCCSSICCS